MSNRANAVASLIHFLKNGNEADRCYAARSLGEINAEAHATEVHATSATAALIERLRDDDLDVCIDAATALGRIAAPDTLPSLLEALKNEPDAEVKTAIIAALGHFNDFAMRDALSDLALNRPPELAEPLGTWDPYWDIQLEAIRSLTRQGGTDRTDDLVALIDNDEHQDIEAEILKVLAHSGEAGFRHLAPKLNDPSPRTRRRAAQALGFQNSENAKLALKMALADADEEVRLSALAAISQLQAGELLTEVIALIADRSARVRQQALSVLAALSVAAGKPILTADRLLPLLADKDSHVRLTILSLVRAMVQKESAKKASTNFSAEALTAIKRCLNSVDPDEAALACAIIGELQDKDAIPSLIRILENTQEDELFRKEAVASLGKLGVVSPEVMSALHQQILGESRVIRLAVLQALLALDQATQAIQDQETQDAQVLTLTDPAEDHSPEVILEPMALLMAAFYGDVVSAPASNPDATEQSEHIELIDLQGDGLEDEPSVAVESAFSGSAVASQSTLASLAEKPLSASAATPAAIPDGYASDYRELNDTESKEVQSTLEAVTRDNVEATLMGDHPVAPHIQSIMNQSIMKMVRELPDELSEFGDKVRANNDAADQMIDQSKRTTLNNDVRHLAARVLASIDVSTEILSEARRTNIERVVEGLILALADQDELLRCEAAESIGLLAEKNPKTPGLSNAFGGLVTQLQFGTPEFRIRAVKALGSLKHPDAILPLLDCLEDSDNLVRIHTIHALGQIIGSDSSGQPVAHPLLLEKVTYDLVTQRIIGMLDDHDSGFKENGIRKAAIEVLADLGNQTALDKMIAIALENEGAMARLVGKALRKMRSSVASLLVTERLRHADNTNDRRFLMEIVGELFKPI